MVLPSKIYRILCWGGSSLSGQACRDCRQEHNRNKNWRAQPKEGISSVQVNVGGGGALGLGGVVNFLGGGGRRGLLLPLRHLGRQETVYSCRRHVLALVQPTVVDAEMVKRNLKSLKTRVGEIKRIIPPIFKLGTFKNLYKN